MTSKTQPETKYGEAYASHGEVTLYERFNRREDYVDRRHQADRCRLIIMLSRREQRRSELVGAMRVCAFAAPKQKGKALKTREPFLIVTIDVSGYVLMTLVCVALTTIFR